MILSISELGRVLRKRRLDLGLSQARLAWMARITQQHLSLVEQGKVDPTYRTLTRLAGSLDLSWTFHPAEEPAWTAKRFPGRVPASQDNPS